MNTAEQHAIPDSHDDLLTEEQLARITGVPKGSPSGLTKRIEVLRKAGIHHWLRYDGTLATTWHHVHNAGQVTAPESTRTLPNFGAIK